MHRSICRVWRIGCRKWRENDCPSLGGEEVHRNRNRQDFHKDAKYSIPEAIGWTTGLFLISSFGHRSRLHENEKEKSQSQNCPWGRVVTLTQPKVFALPTTANSVLSNVHPPSTNTRVKKNSIDTTPFLHESLLASRSPSPYSSDTEDEIVFEDEQSESDLTLPDKKLSVFLTPKPKKENDEASALSLANEVSGDILSILGSFKFLMGSKNVEMNNEQKSDEKVDNPSLEAIELLKKSASLGSSRALYNIGIAYQRLEDVELAEEYFERATELGHPLAAYNLSVMKLREGKFTKGIHLMEFAAKSGIREAKDALDRYSFGN